MRRIFLGGVLGALLVYFLDPKKGSDRRSGTMGKATSILKRGSDAAQQAAQTAPVQQATQAFSGQGGSGGAGATQDTPASSSQGGSSGAGATGKGRKGGKHQPDNPDPDDNTLRDRIESEI